MRAELDPLELRLRNTDDAPPRAHAPVGAAIANAVAAASGERVRTQPMRSIG